VCQGEKFRVGKLGRTFVRSAPGCPYSSGLQNGTVQFSTLQICGAGGSVQGSFACHQGRTRLLQATIAEALLLGAMFWESCQASERAALDQALQGRTACFEAEPSHSRRTRHVHLGSLAPAALSYIGFRFESCILSLPPAKLGIRKHCLVGAGSIQPERSTMSRACQLVKQF
jgi:hypothetical protein